MVIGFEDSRFCQEVNSTLINEILKRILLVVVNVLFSKFFLLELILWDSCWVVSTEGLTIQRKYELVCPQVMLYFDFMEEAKQRIRNKNMYW